MIVMYTSHGCSSCRKAKKYMRDNNLEFIEKDIFSYPLKENEIKYLLSRSENGTEDIISNRSKIIKEEKVDIESMSLNELIKFVVKNPSVLKRPIILDSKNLQVGYDTDEISLFKKNNELSFAL